MTEFRPRTLSLRYALLMAIACPATLLAQARPAGAPRPWVELGLGASRMNPNCDACAQPFRIGGPSASIAVGLTITPEFGIALSGRTFSEFSFDTNHNADYFLALGQYSPDGLHELTLNFGVGTGTQHDDAPPSGENGSGAVVAGGVALRLPSSSLFGFTLNADVLKTVTGNLRTAGSGSGSSYRPTLVTFGIGVNLAGRP